MAALVSKFFVPDYFRCQASECTQISPEPYWRQRDNGLYFSPDEKKLHITDAGAVGGPRDAPSWIRVYDVGVDNKLTNGPVFHDLKKLQPGAISDDIRADTQGNIWPAAG
jgi:sugar lactone lactonase YvrE